MSLLHIKAFYQNYLWQSAAGEEMALEEMLSHVTPDGEGGLWFDDLAYTSQSRSGWAPGMHIRRLLSLVSCSGRARLEDTTFEDTILGLLTHWINHTYIAENWWWNEIGVPLDLGKIALLCEDILPADKKEAIAARVRLGTYFGLPKLHDALRDNWKDTPPNRIWIGANFIWGMTTSFVYGLLTMDDEVIDIVRHEVECMFLRPAGEGINPDHSFYQHGTRWYSGGYGRSFVTSIVPMVYAFLSAGVDFSPEALDLLLSQLLDGARHFTHRGYYDYHAVGRELSRENALHVGGLQSAVEWLAKLPALPRHDELCAFLAEMKGEASPPNHTIFYPYISHLSHQYDGRYYGITGINQGQLGAEHCNGEGVLCYNMTYGSRTCYQGTGVEYHNIDPVFDYAYVPGTTTYYETDGEFYQRDRSWTNRLCEVVCLSAQTWAEGGILTQQVIHDDISLLSTFVVDRGVLVALGTDIQNGSQKQIHTTIDQAFAQEAEIVSERLAHSGLFSYHALSGAAHFTITHKTGSTQRNNLERAPEKREGDVFCATLEDVKESYAYAITPRNTPLVCDILENTPTLQAVRMPSGKIYVACHTDGTFEVDGATYEGKAGACYII